MRCRCQTCNGTGKVTCDECDGEGYDEEQAIEYMKIEQYPSRYSLYNHEEAAALLELQKDAKRVRAAAEQLSLMRPCMAGRYTDQMVEAHQAIEGQAREVMIAAEKRRADMDTSPTGSLPR